MRTNLTTAGTVTVQQFTNSSEPYKYSDNFTVVNGLLFFTAELMNDVDGLFYYDPAVVTSATVPVMEEPSFSIYPNPSSSYLNIKAEKAGEVTILNNVSQVVLKEKVNGHALFRIDQLPAGVYFVRFKVEGQQTVMKKLVKN